MTRRDEMEKEIGSIWTVPDFVDAEVMILAGPFRASSTAQEYLVAPLYTSVEPGNRWTSEDVRIEAGETGDLGTRFAAIWNSRPVLDRDLGLQVALVTAEAVTAVLDAYWQNLNERPANKNSRLGKSIRSGREAVARFQEDELLRWAVLSGRVLETAEELESEGEEAACSAEEEWLVAGSGFSVPGEVFSLNLGSHLDVATWATQGNMFGVDLGGEQSIPPGTLLPVEPNRALGLVRIASGLHRDLGLDDVAAWGSAVSLLAGVGVSVSRSTATSGSPTAATQLIGEGEAGFQLGNAA